MKYLASRFAAIAAGMLLSACGGVASDESSEVSDIDPALMAEANLGAEVYGDDDDDDQDEAVGPVDPARELLITDLSVVEDPVRTKWPVGPRSGSRAAWTFGRIMELMAGSAANAPQFTLAWLEKWEQDQVINGFTSPARPLIKDLIIDPWLAASGGVQLNMRKAPFRLLAIVNRPDLRTGGGALVSAGEGRFVFGALKPDGTPMQFTVIFEYGVPAWGQAGVKSWAKKWHKLGKIPFGATYNNELEKLTRKFTRKGCAMWKPNLSCIDQIRTNEISVASTLPKVWEIRDFRLVSPGVITQVTTVQTPDSSVNGTAALADFINSNEAAVLARKHATPAELLGPGAPESMSNPWNAPGIFNNEARHAFAITTCNGCHTGETGTFFTHVKVRQAGQASALSGFLTGASVADPVTGAIRSFNELAVRAADMQALLAEDDD